MVTSAQFYKRLNIAVHIAGELLSEHIVRKTSCLFINDVVEEQAAIEAMKMIVGADNVKTEIFTLYDLETNKVQDYTHKVTYRFQSLFITRRCVRNEKQHRNFIKEKKLSVMDIICKQKSRLVTDEDLVYTLALSMVETLNTGVLCPPAAIQIKSGNAPACYH